MERSDENMLGIFGGIFETQQAAEDFMKITDGKPKRFMEELYLQGDFTGHIEIKFFEKKTNGAEELFKDFPYGEKNCRGLKSRINNFQSVLIGQKEQRHEHYLHFPQRLSGRN